MEIVTIEEKTKKEESKKNCLTKKEESRREIKIN